MENQVPHTTAAGSPAAVPKTPFEKVAQFFTPLGSTGSSATPQVDQSSSDASFSSSFNAGYVSAVTGPQFSSSAPSIASPFTPHRSLTAAIPPDHGDPFGAALSLGLTSSARQSSSGKPKVPTPPPSVPDESVRAYESDHSGESTPERRSSDLSDQRAWTRADATRFANFEALRHAPLGAAPSPGEPPLPTSQAPHLATAATGKKLACNNTNNAFVAFYVEDLVAARPELSQWLDNINAFYSDKSRHTNVIRLINQCNKLASAKSYTSVPNWQEKLVKHWHKTMAPVSVATGLVFRCPKVGSPTATQIVDLCWYVDPGRNIMPTGVRLRPEHPPLITTHPKLLDEYLKPLEEIERDAAYYPIAGEFLSSDDEESDSGADSDEDSNLPHLDESSDEEEAFAPKPPPKKKRSASVGKVSKPDKAGKGAVRDAPTPQVVSSPKPEEKPGLWQRITTFTHRWSDDDRSMATRVTDAVEGLPAKFADQARELGKNALDSLSVFKLPGGLQEFIYMLSDTLVLALATDMRQIALMNVNMSLRYGFLTTLVLDGLVLFVRQFTKRIYQAEDQGEPTAEDNTSFFSGISALYSAIHYYTIGQLPTSIDKSLIQKLVLLNASFQIARNVEHFGAYFINFLKAAANAVYRGWTGKNYFDPDQHSAIERIALYTASYGEFYRNKVRTREALTRANTLARDSVTLMGEATAAGVHKDVIDPYKKASDAFVAWLGQETSSTHYEDPRPPTVLSYLLGRSGAGKTTLLRLVKSALAKTHGYQGTLAQMSVKYQPGMNFQTRLPAFQKFVDFDDVLLVVDDERYQEFIDIIGRLGSGGPLVHEAAAVTEKDKSFLDVDYGFCLDNKIPNNMPVNSQEPAPRRFTGGIHKVTCKSKYYKKGTKRFNPKVLEGDLSDSELIALIDDIWILEDHLGVKRNFSQYVSMLAAVRNETIRTGHSIEATVSRIAAAFTPVEPKISIPPSSFHAGTTKAFAEDQSLLIDSSRAEFEKWLCPADWVPEDRRHLLDQVTTFLKAHPDKYVFDKTLKCGDKEVTAKELRAAFSAKPEATDVNIKIVPNKWNTETLKAMRGKKFYVNGSCCRHEEYCYRHGRKPCPAFSNAAKEVNHVGVCKWVVEHPDLKAPDLVYHRMVAEHFSPDEDSFVVKALKMFILAIGSSAIGLLVGHLFINYFYTTPEDQAGPYSSKGAQFAKRMGAGKMPVAQLGAKATNQGTVKNVEPDPEAESRTAWLAKRLSSNVYPISVRGGNKASDCQMLRIVGNVAATVSHAFFDGCDTLLVGGLLGLVLPIRRVSTAFELTDFPGAQVVADRKIDLAFVVLPKSVTPCKSILENLVHNDETEISQLTGMVMAMRKMESVEPVMDNTPAGPRIMIPPKVLPELHENTLGDADQLMRYTSNARHIGVSIKTPVRTVKKMCGFPVYTTNTRVGRNHEIVAGIHCAYFDYERCALFAPLPKETVEAFLGSAPPHSLNLAINNSDIQFVEGLVPMNPSMVAVQELPLEQTQFQNTKSSIKPVPESLYRCLEGLVLQDPVTKELVTVPPIDVTAAPIWDIPPAFEKMVLNNRMPDPDTFKLYQECVKRVRDRIIRYAHPDLFKPQEKLFTIDEALNGVPELGIPSLDEKKSPGFNPEHPNAKSRLYYLREECLPRLVLKPEFELIVERMTNMILDGQFTWTYVVNHLKEELRRIGKPARVTSCYNFLMVILKRRFTMHIPAAIISGRVRNGSSFGADLCGQEARAFETGAADEPFTNLSDAKNYDASKSSEFSRPPQEACAYMTRLRFPFVGQEAAISIQMTIDHCLIVVGRKVYLVSHGGQSGDPLTTAYNIIDMSGVVETAWIRTGTDIPFDDVMRRAYGDDAEVRHHNPVFTNPHVAETAALLHVVLTPGDNKDAERRNFDTRSVHLKRSAHKDASGFYMGALALTTINHIHAFIKTKDRDHNAAILQNCNAALREWFFWGRSNFELVKTRINAALLENGLPPSDLDWDILYMDWYNKCGGTFVHPSHAAIPKHLRPMNHLFGETQVREVQGHVENQSAPTTMGISSDKDDLTTVQIPKDPQVQVSSESGVVTRSKLTSHKETGTVSKSSPTYEVLLSQPWRLNIFPPMGQEGMLTRMFKLATILWNTADPVGTPVHATSFPEGLLTVPKILQLLSDVRYLRSAVLVRLSIASNDAVGGALQICTVDQTSGEDEGDGDWRLKWPICCNGRTYVISAAKSSTVEFVLLPASNLDAYDIFDGYPGAMMGQLVAHILAPLSWVTPGTAPVSIPVILEAGFIKPECSGYDVNNLTANRTIFGRKLAHLREVHGVQDQSSEGPASAPIQEAASTAEGGALSTLEGAAQTVLGLIQKAPQLAEMAGAFLDKPLSHAAVVPVRQVTGDDFSTVTGISNAPFLSTNRDSYVSNAKLGFEATPNPSWDNILGTPGLIDFIQIAKDSNEDDLIYDRPVFPTMCYQVNEVGGDKTYMPPPLAYYAQRH